MRTLSRSAFRNAVLLRDAVLSEGLRTLGTHERYKALERSYEDYAGEGGVFSDSGLQSITLPTTLEALGDHVFQRCERLRHVRFRGQSRLARIGLWCFADSGLEEFAAPPSLRVVESGAFARCRRLGRVALSAGLKALGTRAGYCDIDGFSCSFDGVFEGSPLAELTLPGTPEYADESALLRLLGPGQSAKRETLALMLQESDASVSSWLVRRRKQGRLARTAGSHGGLKRLHRKEQK